MPEKEISFDHLKELLLILCRFPFNEEDRKIMSDLLSEVKDWQKMVELINAHGIIALAAYNIREAGLESHIPEDAMAKLDNGWRQSMVRNSWLTERWKEVNKILAEAGIKHILLKGMALEYNLYGAKGLRQMTDNDILVKREDALKGWELLQQKGFSPELIKSSLHKKILCEIGKHLPCLYKDGYAIEIHHKQYEEMQGDEKNVFDPINEAVEIQISDTRAWILPKQIQLKHLIDHFKKHAEGGEMPLRLYADIVLLDKIADIEIPDDFILNPQQNYKAKYLRAVYKTAVNSISKKDRFRYLCGDIFPSVKWMKKRYKCNTLLAILRYPFRVGKLLWLI